MEKGFTLVEVLAVIAIIAILGLIVVPSVESIIKSNEDDVYNEQVELILHAAEDYAIENVFITYLPQEIDEYKTISLGYLKTNGYIDIEINNPKTKQCFGNDILIKITKKKNRFNYELDESSLYFYDADSCDPALEIGE